MTNPTPNTKNLIPLRAGEERTRLSGQKGGKASGEKKRERKLWRDIFIALMSSPVVQKKQLAEIREKFKNLGRKVTFQELLAIKVFQLAMRGDLKAAELIIDRMDGKAKETVTQTNINLDLPQKADRTKILKWLKDEPVDDDNNVDDNDDK